MKIGKVGTAFLLGSLGSLLLAGCGGGGAALGVEVLLH